ncbi:hypothetical protein JTE90_026052 [Oedothorax gibbosus]|uniref:Sulfotransferase domain-containing protein n=1 Tax=Oedothorax gibbosus TaxID=931172 RepID=A0AAV6UCA6_9ARAC|nr:hypothetical protein JTE90_026052 [Oedothorax gibbosus]
MNNNRFCTNVEGINIPCFFSEECFRSALAFKPKSGDVFVVTYPKCGTTWMQTLVLNILRRGQPLDNPTDFHLASPFLDMLGAEDAEERMLKPGVYKTHLPSWKVPWSANAKYIYVARNPKDCCISFYHHMKVLPGYQFADGSFKEFLDLFLSGEVEYGNYFDHLIPWYNKRNNSNIYFTTFENMKTDFKKVALEVAEFIDKKEAEYLLHNPEVLEKICHNCSFDVMKKIINEGLSALYNNMDRRVFEKLPKGRQHVLNYVQSLPKKQESKVQLVRKGQIGSWSSEMTSEEIDVLNNEIIKRTKDSDVMSLWKSYE